MWSVLVFKYLNFLFYFYSEVSLKHCMVHMKSLPKWKFVNLYQILYKNETVAVKYLHCLFSSITMYQMWNKLKMW
jgi:hypothetical protein